MQLVSKIFNLCGPDPPTTQTDRQTDGRTDNKHYSALCSNKTKVMISGEWQEVMQNAVR